MNCRHCGSQVSLPVIDLGTAPPSNAYVTAEQLTRPERYYPLRVLVCTECWLMQTEDYAQAEDLFDADYAYFSSYSSTWLRHSEAYVDSMIQRLSLSSDSMMVEVAANDGYLLQYAKARGIPCLGIEPTASTASAARARGIDIVEDFFGVQLAQRLHGKGKQADLLIANNVLGHVPDINDFVAGFAMLLKPHGVASFEFPHLLRLIADNQFDTIYHEHYSYLSLTSVQRIFAHAGLRVFDVEELPTHGGSLRVFAQRTDRGTRAKASAVDRILREESVAGMTTPEYYARFQSKAETVKNNFVAFLIKSKQAGRRVGAYGAAAKGSTLLNYGGVRRDLLPYVADRNPAKQGKFLPGSRIPIVGEERLRDDRPDFIVILPWNLRLEIKQQLDYARAWGAKFVTSEPTLTVE